MLQFRFIAIALISVWLPVFTAPLHIALLSDGKGPSTEVTQHIFEREISSLLTPEYDVTFSHLQASWSAASTLEMVNEVLADPSIDMVIGLGEIASHDLSLRHSLPKPTFAPFIVDRDLQGLPFEKGTSGVTNLNYLTYPTSLNRDICVFHSLIPFKNLTVLINDALLTAIPSLKASGVTYVPVGNTVEMALAAIPAETEAVYLFPLSRLSDKETQSLVEALTERRIPTFALSGRKWVEQGALATLTPDSPEKRLARRIAVNIQRYLMGEALESMQVEVNTEEQLILNLYTACRVNVQPSWDMLLDADVVGGYVPTAFTMDLLDAVDEALSHNPDLKAARRVLASGCQDVHKATSYLLPHVYMGGLARIIDRDRAFLAFGLQPQSAIIGTAAATQVIYSNRLQGNLSIEQRRQEARWEVFVSKYLDTVLDASKAYINTLRANTLHAIQIANLRRTRSNLKMARQRVSIGEARSTEVFRWESEVATNRTNAIKAQYQVRSANTALNRILNRNQAEIHHLVPMSPDDPYWVLSGQWFDHYSGDNRSLELASEFEISEGLQLSPQIRQVESLIAAQAEALGVAKRAFFAPDVNFAAEVHDRLAKGGAGQKGIFPLNNSNFAVGIALTYPILTGGMRSAEERQASQDLARLNYELVSVQQQIEQGIRTSLNNATASYAAIGLSRQSSDAAEKNLQLVTDAYTKGSLNVVDLLDAQNQSLVADQVAANAVYDFLIDSVQLQRAVGRFDFLLTENEREDLLGRIHSYLTENKRMAPCVAQPQ